MPKKKPIASSMPLRTSLLTSRKKPWRLGIICALIIVVGLAHWITPASQHQFHTFHVIFRKFFVLPIILAAIWFEITGALAAALIISIIYVPHIFIQWTGQVAENVNQLGEVATIWIIAILSGIFSRLDKNALREVARTHEGSLIAMVAALDAREHDTEMHSLRVRQYALRLGRKLALNNRQIHVLSHGSLLHDIGKIGIPDTILLKPAALDADEWNIMKQHPTIGRRVLASVPFLRDAAEMVYCHHEWYDGSGYPRGLRAERIPIEARIFAVVDVFDALTSERPYHSGRSYEQARSEITRESGTHFDPRVVKAFLQIDPLEWQAISDHVSDKFASAAHPKQL